MVDYYKQWLKSKNLKQQDANMWPWPQQKSNGPACVYIAGPINGSGDPEQNVKNAIDAGDAVLSLGIIPFVPHLFWYWNQRHEHTGPEWLRMDFVWLAKCDALLRLPGVSPGSDEEVELCNRLQIPVFHTVEDLHAWWLSR